jgi:hypothetical protein
VSSSSEIAMILSPAAISVSSGGLSATRPSVKPRPMTAESSGSQQRLAGRLAHQRGLFMK